MIASEVFYLNNGNENRASLLLHIEITAVGQSMQAAAFGRRMGRLPLPQN